MRLHRLQAQAFGPFAETVSVDFDELSEAGLFLLSGATGAGKTSVLDAVCFALYGDVPGDRSTAKRLRSDQAAPGVVPRVELELTLGDRRFRFVRSPTWDRPKKRGTGTTTEPARVTVSELVDGGWQPLSSRLDETGDLVARVVGLTQTQFTQVAMLPQGRFQAFLRAKSDERHRLLQQLFRTGRFEAVERWLAEHRKTLARADAHHHERTADVVSRAAEAAGTALPVGIDLHDLALSVDDGTLRAWFAAAAETSRTQGNAAQRRLETSSAAELDARTGLERARAAAQTRRRLDGARRELAGLLAAAEDRDDAQGRVEAGRRAAGVVPWLRLAEAAAVGADAASARESIADATLREHLPTLAGGADLTALGIQAGDAAAQARALRPRAERLAELDHRRVSLERRRRQIAIEVDEVERLRAVRPAEVERLAVEVSAAREAVGSIDSLTAQAQHARGRLDAHGEAARLQVERNAARERWLVSRETTVTAKDALVTLQLARVEGMAAELAGALVVGGCCPVCGSADHPTLARVSPGAPDAASEKSARRDVGDAEVVEHALDQQVRDLERALAAATARAGDLDPVTLVSQLADHQTSLAEALRTAGRVGDLEARLAARQDDLERADARLTALRSDAAVADTEHHGLSAESRLLRAELGALGVAGLHDLGALAATHRRTTQLSADVLRARHDCAEAAWSAAQAHRALHEAAAEAGFADPDSAVAAVLDPAALTRLAEVVAHHDQRLAALTEVLREAPHEGDAPRLDLDAAIAAHATALEASRLATAETALHTGRAARVGGLLAELDVVLAAWAPLRVDLELAARLALFVEGRSSDNMLRMRLSAFVLAYRLGQVVASANERLAKMSDQRYALEHTGQRGAGETRGGLSLLVRDDWSGESRDPATLSGGETFVVSLALALGLADVIAHEAGGACLDTLFVDEGFGSLDADTLDDVMDTLDALRDGGRVVGVVSHVAEMRDRIPTQLVVTKSRHGSTVSLRR